jgi:chromosome segregation ATPase
VPIIKNAGVVVLALVMCASCIMAARVDPQSPNDRLSAENSQMKRRLPLIERENEILKEESLEYRIKVRNLDAQIEKLSRGLTSSEEKYTHDMALSAEHNRQLQAAYELLEHESAEKNWELVDSKNELERKLTARITELDKQIIAQKKGFIKESERVKQESAKKEVMLAGQVKDLKNTLEARDEQIIALKKSIGELELKFGAASARIEKDAKIRMDLENKLESLKAEKTELDQKLKILSDVLEKTKAVF